MKLQRYTKSPKVDLDDYTRAEQKLLMLMAGVRGEYKTDYFGMEKAITVRLNCNNAPAVDALAELSNLSKNLVINDLLDLAFGVLEENLSPEDKQKFITTLNRKHGEWLDDYQLPDTASDEMKVHFEDYKKSLKGEE